MNGGEKETSIMEEALTQVLKDRDSDTIPS